MNEPHPDPLEVDRQTLDAWLAELGGWALDHVDALDTAPAVGPVGEPGLEIARAVSAPIPELPVPGGAAELRRRLALAAQASLNSAGPGYLAYIPGGGLPTAAMAEFIAACINRYTGLSATAPALCRLETDVMQWLAAEFGYDHQARGLLTSGGSLANFSAIITARHHRLGDDGNFTDATAYTSDQAHHSVTKSLALAGIPAANVRAVATDDRRRMLVKALQREIDKDRRAGKRPFLVVSAAGTTNTGAVDPLPEISQVTASEGLWHHVDGAYGGAFVLCEEGRRRLAGIETADSITFDPHKGMFLPYGTGCLLVRDGRLLRAAHRADAGYLQDVAPLESDGVPPSSSDYGPELSRGFRGLRLWLPLMLHGARAFRNALTEKLELAQRFHRGLRELVADGAPLQILDEPQLSIVPFRLSRRPGETREQFNTRNERFQAAINARERVYLSSTRLTEGDEAVFTLRVAVLSFRTHRAQIDQCLADIEAALAEAR